MVCRQGKGCDDGGVMVITAALRHHDHWGAEGDGESARLHRTPPDSGGLPTKQSPVDWSTGLDSTGLHWTTVQLQSGCFEWFSNGYGWPLSPVESGGVRQSPTGLCGGGIRTPLIDALF